MQTLNRLRKKVVIGLCCLAGTLSAQVFESKENFGRTLNFSAGLCYFNYIGQAVEAAHINYELQIDKNLTVAPFLTVYTYQGQHRWGDVNNEVRYYDFRETVVPMGLKVSYYFDDLLRAGTAWDFYSSVSIGFNYRNATWENPYYGPRNIHPGMGPLYLDAHLGIEYHLTKTIGLHLDLSTGLATFGIAAHLPTKEKI